MCDRKGGHALNMNGLRRDYDIKSCDGDNTCIGQELMCNPIKKSDVFGKTDQVEEYFLLPIRKFFYDLIFGRCSRNICGGTRGENLYAILRRLCEYIS